jgi:hypothetical protein
MGNMNPLLNKSHELKSIFEAEANNEASQTFSKIVELEQKIM